MLMDLLKLKGSGLTRHKKRVSIYASTYYYAKLEVCRNRHLAGNFASLTNVRIRQNWALLNPSRHDYGPAPL